MRILRSVIVEDESAAANMLKDLIDGGTPEVQVVAIAGSVQEAFEAINIHRPEIVFLDIKLGKESGFELLSRFESFFFNIVFTTAHDEYALKAFDYPSPHFLIKPINLDKLRIVVNRIHGSIVRPIVQEAAQFYPEPQTPGKLAYSTASTTELINYSDIEYLSAEGSYTSLHLLDGSQRVSSKILGHYEKSIADPRFCRIHRKFIVNLEHVKGYDKSKALVLKLTSGSSIQSSSIYKDRLLEKLKKQVTY